MEQAMQELTGIPIRFDDDKHQSEVDQIQYGGFEKNDIPINIQLISERAKKRDELVFRISWKDRNDGTKLEDTYSSYKIINKKAPQLLLKYFEQWYKSEFE